MGVPPPIGRSQQKWYSVSGLPEGLDPDHIPAHKKIVCDYERLYRAYIQAREDIGRKIQGKYFRVSFQDSAPQALWRCPEAEPKSKSKAPANSKAKRRRRAKRK